MGKKLWKFFRGKTMYLVTNDNTGEHDNDWALLLENHTPQILHCAWEWPLCGYILGQICIPTALHSPHKTKLCNLVVSSEFIAAKFVNPEHEQQVCAHQYVCTGKSQM